jgi:hypothetical protein
MLIIVAQYLTLLNIWLLLLFLLLYEFRKLKYIFAMKKCFI